MLKNFEFNLSVTNKNQIQCTKHSGLVSKVQTTGDGGLEFFCDKCECYSNYGGVNRNFTFHADKERQFCTISFSDLSAPLFSHNQENSEGSVMDFRNLEIEHVIVDNNSQGYSPRNLVDIPDLNVLVACSSNGTVTIWSIAEAVQLRSQFNFGRPIGFAKYIDRGEYGTNYLIMGSGTQLYVYVILEDNLLCARVMNCEFEVYDAEWIPPGDNGDKLVISGNGNALQIWDMSPFSLERTINLETYGMKGPIYKLIYLNHTNLLALENMTGVSLISVGKEGIEIEGLPKHVQIPDRKLLGLAYA